MPLEEFETAIESICVADWTIKQLGNTPPYYRATGSVGMLVIEIESGFIEGRTRAAIEADVRGGTGVKGATLFSCGFSSALTLDEVTSRVAEFLWKLKTDLDEALVAPVTPHEYGCCWI